MSKFRGCCVENAWARLVLLRGFDREVGDGGFTDMEARDYFEELLKVMQEEQPTTSRIKLQRDMCKMAWDYAAHGCGIRG